MTVYFIGAGPGAADLITVRGQRLLQRCAVCLYAGSIMPTDLLEFCSPEAHIVNTGPLTLDQIIDEIADADAAGHDVARLHSGDPGLYSAVDSSRWGSLTKSSRVCPLSLLPQQHWVENSLCRVWRRR